MTDFYTIYNAHFNPEKLSQSLFAQVLHARDHWVVVSNYNPSYVDSDDGCYNWFLYDSMNNPKYYLNFIKPALKRLSGGSRFFNIINVKVSKQKGTKNCGLFALGYSLALAIDIDPGKIVFDQNKIRSEFCEIIKNKNLYLFLNAVKENHNPKFTSIFVDLL